MSESYGTQTAARLIQTAIIAVIGLSLFLGLEGRILKFAPWATLESAPGETVMVPNHMFFPTILERRVGTVIGDLEQQLHHNSPADTALAGRPVTTA